MSKRSTVWMAVLVCLVLAQIAGSLLLAQHKYALAAVSDLVQCALLLAAAISCFPNFIRTTKRVRLFWLLMSLGLITWLTYQALWTYIEVVQKSQVPSLFAGDAVLFLHFVPMMAALALQPNIKRGEETHRLGSLDFGLLLVWWFYLYIYSVLPWQYAYPSELAYNHNLNLAYLVEKIAFLGALAVLWFRSSGLWKKIYMHFLGASLLYSVSSYVANWALERNRYFSGSLYDVPLVASMAWMAVPGLLALSLPAEPEASETALPRGVWTARLGMLAVFSLPVFAWLCVFNHAIPVPVRSFRLVLTLGVMLLMGVLVFFKQYVLDLELIRLLRSSRQSFQDLQLLQEQLVQSEKLASLGQMVGGAAHELNNPLTALLGYSDLLATTDLSHEQKALSEKIATQAKRIRALVASLLSFAKQVPAAKSSLDVNAVVQTAMKLCQPQAQAANVQFSSNFGESLPRVRGDSNQLLKVFSHIINNASHAMGEQQRGGLLTISTSADNAFVKIRFSDTGPGISHPGRVFDPFYSTRPVGEATGLGLSVSYGIVQGHGGKISCSNSPEGGASFLVELPVLKETHPQKLQAQAHTARL